MVVRGLCRVMLLVVVSFVARNGLGQQGPPESAVERMTMRIDALLAESWRKLGVMPSPPATDAEFLRRAYLDLTGLIPTASEAIEFLESADPKKRHKLTESLLAGPAHARHLATIWTQMLLPANLGLDQSMAVLDFQDRMRRAFARRTRYDRIVADLLVVTGSERNDGRTLYFTALEVKPEELAAATARNFLGV